MSSEQKRKYRKNLSYQPPFRRGRLEWSEKLGYHYCIYDDNDQTFDRIKLQEDTQESMLRFKQRVTQIVRELNSFVKGK